jgi:hypothetical protein
MLLQWFIRHWLAFWRSASDNLYTYIWWAVFTAVFAAMVTVGAWFLSLFGYAGALSKWEDRFLSAFVALLFVIVMTLISAPYRKARTTRRLPPRPAPLTPHPAVVISTADGLRRHQLRIDTAYKDFTDACDKTVNRWSEWDRVTHESEMQQIGRRASINHMFEGPEPTEQEVKVLRAQLQTDMRQLQREVAALAEQLEVVIP